MMKIRAALALAGTGLLLLLAVAAGCAFMHTQTHGMSIVVHMPDRYGEAVKKVLASGDGAQLLPEREKARQANEADYAEVVRLVNEWARHEGFCLIPIEQYPRLRLHLVPSQEMIRDKRFVFYEDHFPADPKWPIQMNIFVVESGGELLDVQIAAGEGFHRQPSERLKQAYNGLRKTLAGRFGERVKGSIW